MCLWNATGAFDKKTLCARCITCQDISNDHLQIVLSICLCNVIGAFDKKTRHIRIDTKHLNLLTNKKVKEYGKERVMESKTNRGI